MIMFVSSKAFKSVFNITIKDETDLDKIEYSYPGLPSNGTIKVSRDMEIPGPQEIEDSIQ